MDSIDYKKLYHLSEVESKDFTRFKINGLLQVDFVNDLAFRYKDNDTNE